MFKKIINKLFGKKTDSFNQASQPQSILDFELLQLSPYVGDSLTVGNFCENTIILGGTGSGKSSGSGRNIAEQFLKSGFGGLVLCAKPDELGFWLDLINEQDRANGQDRADDLIIFDSKSDCYFNFLDYECNRPGEGAGQTENLISLFLNVLEATKKGSGNTEEFFVDSAKDLMRNAIDLARLAGEKISITLIGDIINSAPLSIPEVNKMDTSKLCFSLLRQVDDRLKAGKLNTNDEHDYKQTFTYWTKKFPAIADKTRSSIVMTFDAMGAQFARGELYRRFCTETTVTPEETFDGKIIIMNYPIKEFGDVGLYAQVVFKTLWQQAIERRIVNKDTYPAFLWIDECQFFLTPYDQEFLTTARSACAMTVYLTQNIPNLVAKLGEGNRAAVDSLLGNFVTKIFHSNGDVKTNNWASELIGTAEKTKTGYSSGSSSNSEGQNYSSSGNVSTHRESLVHPHEFADLRKGGPTNNSEVDAIVYQSGKRWAASGETFLKVTFVQQSRS